MRRFTGAPPGASRAACHKSGYWDFSESLDFYEKGARASPAGWLGTLTAGSLRLRQGRVPASGQRRPAVLAKISIFASEASPGLGSPPDRPYSGQIVFCCFGVKILQIEQNPTGPGSRAWLGLRRSKSDRNSQISAIFRQNSRQLGWIQLGLLRSGLFSGTEPGETLQNLEKFRFGTSDRPFLVQIPPVHLRI